jgi:hypothetical protein
MNCVTLCAGSRGGRTGAEGSLQPRRVRAAAATLNDLVMAGLLDVVGLEGDPCGIALVATDAFKRKERMRWLAIARLVRRKEKAATHVAAFRVAHSGSR